MVALGTTYIKHQPLTSRGVLTKVSSKNVDPLEAARLAANSHTHALRKVYESIAELKKNTDIDPKRRAASLSRLYAKLSWRDVRASISKEVERKRIGVSFRASISHIRLVKHELRRLGYEISPGGNPKMQDRAFADALGIPTPKTLQTGQTALSLSINPNTVVKPITGAASKGVFLINDDTTAISVYSGEQYESFLDGLKTEYGSTNLVSAPVWVSETRVGSIDAPARDLKVFCFYGKAALIEEIHRHTGAQGKNEYCFYYPNGEKVFVDTNRARYNGDGFPSQIIEYAEAISSNSPVPFLRVDFMESEGHVVLGEITPQPGGTYAGQLHEHIDRELGESFLKAEARLFVDLINGKRFDTYFDSYPNARPQNF